MINKNGEIILLYLIMMSRKISQFYSQSIILITHFNHDYKVFN